jgi:hypothetical protein
MLGQLQHQEFRRGGDTAWRRVGLFQSGLMVLNSTFSANTPDNIFGPYIDGGGNTFS